MYHILRNHYSSQPYLASLLSWHPHKKWQISPLITTTKKQLLISEMGKASETLRAQGISFLLMKAFRSWSPFKSLLSVASCLFMIALQHIAISACGGHEGHTPLKKNMQTHLESQKLCLNVQLHGPLLVRPKDISIHHDNWDMDFIDIREGSAHRRWCICSEWHKLNTT